ncbi:lipopolysaccharide heptosyltransferase II [Planctomycetota bacterium]
MFLPNWIGDVAMATPTLRAIRQHYGPAARITGIQRPYVAEVLAGTNWLSDRIEFNPKAKSSSERRGTWNLVRELRRREFDTAIILPNSPRPALAAWLAQIPQRIGYSRYCRGPLLTEKLRPPRNGSQLLPVSALDYYLSIAAAIGANTSNGNIELRSTQESDSEVRGIWNTLDLSGRRVIAFNTGGAYGAAKSWPAEHFSDLAKRFVAEGNTSVIIACGPAERESADLIQKLSGTRHIHSLSRWPSSIGLTKAVIKHSDMLVTTDSGPRFFGTAFSVPTITLFGSTDPQWSQTGHPLEVNMNIDVDCGPCSKRVCPLKHHRCMQDLTPEHVFARAQRILSLPRPDAA